MVRMKMAVLEDEWFASKLYLRIEPLISAEARPESSVISRPARPYFKTKG